MTAHPERERGLVIRQVLKMKIGITRHLLVLSCFFLVIAVLFFVQSSCNPSVLVS